MKARPQGRRSTVRLFAALALFAAPGLALADGGGNADEAYRFDIEAGDAAFRLNDFATQSGFQVLFPFADMAGVTVTPVHGDMKPFDALKKMIAGTGIRYQYTKGKSVTVTLTMARSNRGEQGTASPRVRGVAHARDKDRRTPDSGLQEVTIRSGNAISIAENGSRPISLGRADIDAPGFITVQDVVRTLPQVFGGGPTEDTYTVGPEAPTNTSRGVGVNLRGLGAASTLVLMNGRRLAGTGTEGLFVDVSNLPLAAVERVDILPDTSSTFYGADAVGGVVNFVMRDQFEGWETEGFFGAATKGQLNENYASQLYGAQGDKAHGLLAIDFYSRDNLTAASRPQARSDLTQFGGSNFDSLQSSPGNILMGPNVYAIPRGQDGSALSAADFLPGTPNLQNKYEAADVLPSQQRWSVFGTGHYDQSDTLELFGDVLFTRRNMHGSGSGYGRPLIVPTSNAFFPDGFSTPLTIQYSFLQDLGALENLARITTTNLSGGLDWKVGRDWTITATGSYASERVRAESQNQVNGTALARALADPDRTTAFNPFGDGSYTNPATLDAIRAYSSTYTRSDVLTAGLIATGPLLSLWGRDVALTFGIDGRRQEFHSTLLTDATTPTTDLRTNRRRDIHSLFAEVKVPLIGREHGMRGIESLDLSLAERFETYEDFGDTAAPRLGLAWVPVHGLTVRSTYSESFRPPGLLDLDESSNGYAYYSIPNAQTGQTDMVLVWFGKNRDLRQENAHSWTTGIELESPERPGNAIAFTYFNTQFVDRVSRPVLSADLLSNESLSALITRDPSDEFRADVCARSPNAGSAAGPCVGIPVAAVADLRLRNDAAVKTSGIDLLARYAVDSSLGRISLNLNGTYVLRFSDSLTSYMPLVNRVSTPSYPVNLRIRSSARWERGAFDVSAYANFLNDYTDKTSIPRREIDSWTTFDLHASYRLKQGLFDGTTVSLGIDNVFDKPPPFVNNVVGIGYDQENGDLIGRVVSLTLRKKW